MVEIKDNDLDKSGAGIVVYKCYMSHHPPLAVVEIKDNDLDKSKSGIVVYLTLHEISDLLLDKSLDLIYWWKTVRIITTTLWATRKHSITQILKYFISTTTKLIWLAAVCT